MIKLTKAARNLKPGEILCKKCSGFGFFVYETEQCWRCKGTGTENISLSSQQSREAE